MAEKIRKSDQEWRQQLNDEQYNVTRCGGTECAFTGEYWNNHDPGMYNCRCCGEPLFSSETKYDSGTGWPSFYQPVDERNVERLEDPAYGMIRTEVRCNKCGAHLGHVFPDGPGPTGERFCMNSASLKFEKK
jgi:peptide-methionine (R)-S-oxide reductase